MEGEVHCHRNSNIGGACAMPTTPFSAAQARSRLPTDRSHLCVIGPEERAFAAGMWGGLIK
jgi:hypothetical protein